MEFSRSIVSYLLVGDVFRCFILCCDGIWPLSNLCYVFKTYLDLYDYDCNIVNDNYVGKLVSKHKFLKLYLFVKEFVIAGRVASTSNIKHWVYVYSFICVQFYFQSVWISCLFHFTGLLIIPWNGLSSFWILYVRACVRACVHKYVCICLFECGHVYAHMFVTVCICVYKHCRSWEPVLTSHWHQLSSVVTLLLCCWVMLLLCQLICHCLPLTKPLLVTDWCINSQHEVYVIECIVR